VVVLAVTGDGNAIFTEQWRPGSDGPVDEFPGGHRKQGQTIEEALADELEEEVGYKAGRVISLPEFWLDPPSNQVVVAGYLALNCKKVSEPKPERTEIIQKVELPIGKLIERLLANGENHKDSKTLSLLFLALPHLAKEGFVTFLPTY
jgi:ADP-ribose pyrophosphatase